MYKGHTVAVVVTAYNEAGFVGEVIETLPGFVDRAYVVDDASTDGTWAEVMRYAAVADGGAPVRESADATTGSGTVTASGSGTVTDAEDPTDVDAATGATAPTRDGHDRAEDRPFVVSIRHEQNRGVGAAIVTGYRRAYEDDMDVVAVMNGDGQMDPEILDRIVDPVVEGRADYAKGNRLLSREHTRGMGAWRRFGNGCLTLLTKAASGYWKTMDPQNGYTAISREAIGALDLDSLYDRYGFLNDLLVSLNTRGMRVADVEMRALYADEESSISYSSFIPRVSRLLVSSFLRRLTLRYLVNDFNPLVGLYAIGILGPLVGFLQAGLLVATGVAPVRAASTALTVGVVSAVALVLAMTLDAMANEHLETRDLTDDRPDPRRHGSRSLGPSDD